MAREPVRKTVFHAQWISWDDACKQGERVVGSLELVATRLKKGLQEGKIPSIDEVITGPGTVETIDLPPEFWSSTVRIVAEPGFGSLVVAWYPNRGSTLPGGIAQKSKHNIFLGREAIDAMWPTETGATAPGKVSPDRRKPGRKPKHDWPTEVAAELIRIIHFEGVPENDHGLARRLKQFCEDQFSYQPPPSEMRALIARLLRPVRQK
jgi:hypothetical protein